jgi:hypothetical protein
MFIDGVLYPLHLAVSSDWKVHYFSADMARHAAFREEERRFLRDMPGVLGTRAMRALERVCATLGLEYAGIDFALAPDGTVLLFEANATMALVPPAPGEIWDYRRPAIETALDAARRCSIPAPAPFNNSAITSESMLDAAALAPPMLPAASLKERGACGLAHVLGAG